MNEKRPYREGDDPEPTVSQVNPVDGSWWSKPGGEGAPRPPERGEEEDASRGPSPNEELYTAVLLVQTHGGQAFAVTDLPNLQLHHEATPHEVFRIACDVADQISGVRVIGEVVRLQHQLTKDAVMTILQQLAPALGLGRPSSTKGPAQEEGPEG